MLVLVLLRVFLVVICGGLIALARVTNRLCMKYKKMYELYI